MSSVRWVISMMIVERLEDLQGMEALKWIDWLSCSKGKVVSIACKLWVRCSRLGEMVRKPCLYAVSLHETVHQ